VPYWQDALFNEDAWKVSVTRSFNESNATEGISLYIHLPFCESLCTFCGCHKRITKRHEVEHPYILAVLKEWNGYCDLFTSTPIIKEIHLGGGTPTFFSPENLEMLLHGIFERATRAAAYEFSFEGHPNNTSKQHLQTLYDLGFRRVSFGVQDYAKNVQEAIHRIQPFQNVAKVTYWAKEIGYTSIGHDLIFGLPFQTLDNVLDTINKTNSLQPDRLAFYSYAHVPWIKGNGQRGFDDNDLPRDHEKRQLYEQGKKLLANNGYHEIGMDHFALANDSLYTSSLQGKLHRNFMGYTASKTQLMIGLGVSSISDSWYAFAQNEKSIEDYYASLSRNPLPVYRGHLLSAEDIIIRKHILNLMCHFKTSWEDSGLQFSELPIVLEHLYELEQDGLLLLSANSISITEKGKPFVRNICMAFDLHLIRKVPETKLFSMTV
jgi:oxygen-independent coproporphyrinogen-3 oxidase